MQVRAGRQPLRVVPSGDREEPSGTVLHVVESFGGGVQNVVYDYIEATPEYRHVVLAASRLSVDTRSTKAADRFTLIGLPRRPLRAVLTLRRVVAMLRPGIVHAHSTLAGALVRLTPGVRRQTVIYSPHCYFFERRDISMPVRGACWSAERLLALRTRLVVAVSPREVDLAARLGNPGSYVPNVAAVPPGLHRLTLPEGASPEVVALGRAEQQKDPQFFAAVARAWAARPDAPGVRFTWIGGGAQAAVLRDAGVEVTGWMPHADVLDRLAHASVYVHTAQWEGAPLSWLEAVAVGLPTVIRRIPAMASFGLEPMVDTPAEAGDRIAEVLRDGVASAVPGAVVLPRHSAADQRDALRAAYTDVMAARPDLRWVPQGPGRRDRSVSTNTSAAMPRASGGAATATRTGSSPSRG